MSTEYIGIAAPLLQKAKEAAAEEHISVEELIRDAVERRLKSAGIQWSFR